MRKMIELTGQIYGRLKVIGLESRKPKPRWICVCDCGTIKSITSGNLLNGKHIFKTLNFLL